MRALLLLVLLGSCGKPQFEPPEHPPHTEREDGVMHAVRMETPFLCGTANEPNAERGAICPTGSSSTVARLDDDRLSCDAVGCHGGFDFTDRTSGNRDLYGSDGPSCYTCHGREWRSDLR